MRNQIVKGLINKIGSTIKIIAPNKSFNDVTAKAVIQPATSLNNIYKKDIFSSLGSLDQNKYVFFGSYDVRIDKYPVDTKVICGCDKYIIKNSEKVSIGDEIIYTWAVLQKCIEA